jgi:hypothetical protein
MSIQKPRFPIADKMPYEPSALRIPRYALPSLLGKAEKEEAAARLLTLIHEKGVWTGITWRELAEQMKVECDAHAKEDEVMQVYYESLRWYRVLCVVSLGLYQLFAKKPTEPQQPKRAPHFFTIIFLMGPGGVVNGLRGLISDGLIRKETVGEGDEAEDVFYPTVKLVERLSSYVSPESI